MAMSQGDRLRQAAGAWPADFASMLVLADWLEETGKDREARAWRALGGGRLCPYRIKRKGITTPYCWSASVPGGRDSHYHLPPGWFKRLCMFDYRTRHLRLYTNARSALLDAATAHVLWGEP